MKPFAALVTAAAVVAGLAAPADAGGRRGTCPEYHALLAAHGLPVATFSRIMWRESRCQPAARSRTRDTGLLQINDVHHRWIRRTWHVAGPVVAWLQVPEHNVAVAGALYRRDGTRPWRATR